MKNPLRKIYDLASSFTEEKLPKLLQKTGMSEGLAKSLSELSGGLAGIVGIITAGVFGVAALVSLPATATLGGLLALGTIGVGSVATITASLGLGKAVFSEFVASMKGPAATAPVTAAPAEEGRAKLPAPAAPGFNAAVQNTPETVAVAAPAHVPQETPAL
jgi:hypothetical protein